MIENTQSDSSMGLTGLLMLATGESGGVIEAQERAGQSQLVHSDSMPTKLTTPRQDFEVLGFTFGDPDPADPLFMPATLPDGWKREGSDHAMWPYIADQLGRRRASVFYKAAFYDRHARASLDSVYTYVAHCAYEGQAAVTDDTWATVEAVLGATAKHIAHIDDQIEHLNGRPQSEIRDTALEELSAERAKFEAIRAAVQSA